MGIISSFRIKLQTFRKFRQFSYQSLMYLLEELLGEHGQIDAPVAPDVTTVGQRKSVLPIPIQ